MRIKLSQSPYFQLVENLLEMAGIQLEAECVILSVLCKNLVKEQVIVPQNSAVLQNSEGYKVASISDYLLEDDFENCIQEGLFSDSGELLGHMFIINPAIEFGEDYNSTVAIIKTQLIETVHLIISNHELVYRNEQNKSLKLISKVSHEIRTPLHALFGNTRVLLDSGLNSEQQEVAENILKSEKLLMNLVNEVLDFSEVKSEDFSLVCKPTYISELLEDVKALYSPIAKEKGLHIEIEESDVELAVLADSMRLSQVLGNLINNAIKFTGSGKVTLRANRISHNTYQFEVEDTGKGIPESFQNSMFEEYTQAKEDSEFGTGLGLAICKTLVNNHGGDIYVKSPVSNGSESIKGGTVIWFTIEAEVSRKADEKEKTNISHNFANKNILLVDDDELIQTLSTHMLAKEGVETYLATSGLEALDMVRNHHIDAVFLDVELGGMNGFETCQNLKELLGEHTPIVMFSSHRDDKTKERAYEAGFTHFLTKPFNSRTLQKTLRDLDK
ncbi:response regulator [Litoribacter ruber]|uniref:response regulator n=1 Tax=Litoribacter ruber TaxID=702568 RepID=UPI001BDA7D9F|nr:response regulator [Litoribacter ruber]MBT0811529.1 response regulator [Litoribacter ruber]